jgi:cytoskeletal protein RodZ
MFSLNINKYYAAVIVIILLLVAYFVLFRKKVDKHKNKEKKKNNKKNKKKPAKKVRFEDESDSESESEDEKESKAETLYETVHEPFCKNLTQQEFEELVNGEFNAAVYVALKQMYNKVKQDGMDCRTVIKVKDYEEILKEEDN